MRRLIDKYFEVLHSVDTKEDADIADMGKNRYESGHVGQRYAEDDEDTDARFQELPDAMRDPKLWLLRCKPGHERLLVRAARGGARRSVAARGDARRGNGEWVGWGKGRRGVEVRRGTEGRERELRQPRPARARGPRPLSAPRRAAGARRSFS